MEEVNEDINKRIRLYLVWAATGHYKTVQLLHLVFIWHAMQDAVCLHAEISLI